MSMELEPGVVVRHPAQPDWGLGRVQSAIGTRVTVSFEEVGKRTLDLRHVTLEVVVDTSGARRG